MVVGVSVAETERRVRTRDRSQKRRVSENERQRSCHLLYLKPPTLLLISCPPSPTQVGKSNMLGFFLFLFFL